MKRAIAVGVLASFAVLAASPRAHAESWFEIETGVAFVHSQRAGDGLWYWEQAAHSQKDNNAGVRAGVQFNAMRPDHWVPGVRMHLDYYNFGTVNWSGNAGEDPNPAHSMGFDSKTGGCYNNDCGDWRKFTSSGGMQAIALTIEPYWDMGNGWTVGIEAGPVLYRSTWTSVATALSDGGFGATGTEQVFSRAPRWQFGQIFGFSVGKGNFTLRYDYLRAPVDSVQGGSTTTFGGVTSPSWVPSGIRAQHMVSLNYRF